MLRPAKCVLTDNDPQTDVLTGGKGTAAVSTKIISILPYWVPLTLSMTELQDTAPSDVSNFVRSKGCLRNCLGSGDCQEGMASGRNQM